MCECVIVCDAIRVSASSGLLVVLLASQYVTFPALKFSSPAKRDCASLRTGSVGRVLMSSDLDRQIEQLKRCEYIKEAEVKALCAKAREILVEESNVQRVDAPVTVRPWEAA